MQVAILGDDQTAAERLLSALIECNVVCPVDRIRSIQESGSIVNGLGRDLDVLFLMLNEDERCLELLEELCAGDATRVVAVGSARDPQFILRVVHAGPSDYLDIDGNLTADLQRALGRLRSAPSTPSSAGRVVSVFSHCGGSGCSLLAANLAVAIAAEHKACLLCDFNVRRGDLAALLNVKPQFTVNDVAKNLAKLQPDVFEQALTPHESGVQLLAAPTSLAEVRPIPIEATNRIIALARQTHSWTVVDLEDFFHPEQFEVLRQSDTILFVLRLDYTAVRNARRTFEYLERDKIDGSRIQIVVNQYGRPRELPSAQAEEVLGRPLNHFIPFEPKVANASTNRGKPLMELAPRSRMTRALQSIAEEIAMQTVGAPA